MRKQNEDELYFYPLHADISLKLIRSLSYLSLFRKILIITDNIMSDRNAELDRLVDDYVARRNGGPATKDSEKSVSLERIFSEWQWFSRKEKATPLTGTEDSQDETANKYDGLEIIDRVALNALPVSLSIAPSGAVAVGLSNKDIAIYKSQLKDPQIVTAPHGFGMSRVISFVENSSLIVSGGLDGSIVTIDSESGKVVTKLVVHANRLIQAMAVAQLNGVAYIATVGNNKTLVMSKMDLNDPSSLAKMFEEKLKTNGTSLAFAPLGPENLQLCLTRNDCSHVMVYDFLNSEPKVARDINLNEAQYGDASFTAMHISVYVNSAAKKVKLAVATNHTPYMRVFVVELNEAGLPDNILTMAPQDAYSTPYIAWSRDGEYIWVSGDDGKLRVLDALSYKLVGELDGHEQRIRSMAVLNMATTEQILTGGTDKSLIEWKTKTI